MADNFKNIQVWKSDNSYFTSGGQNGMWDVMINNNADQPK